jgi:hypothetical protein
MPCHRMTKRVSPLGFSGKLAPSLRTNSLPTTAQPHALTSGITFGGCEKTNLPPATPSAHDRLRRPLRPRAVRAGGLSNLVPSSLGRLRPSEFLLRSLGKIRVSTAQSFHPFCDLSSAARRQWFSPRRKSIGSSIGFEVFVQGVRTASATIPLAGAPTSLCLRRTFCFRRRALDRPPLIAPALPLDSCSAFFQCDAVASRATRSLLPL